VRGALFLGLKQATAQYRSVARESECRELARAKGRFRRGFLPRTVKGAVAHQRQVSDNAVYCPICGRAVLCGRAGRVSLAK